MSKNENQTKEKLLCKLKGKLKLIILSIVLAVIIMIMSINTYKSKVNNNIVKEASLPEVEVKVPETIKEAKETQEFFKKTATIVDEKGNSITIPCGFKVAKDSGDTAQQGIVVEDNEGNEFVWIPVSNIDGSGTGKIILDNGQKTEIILGRYEFDVIYDKFNPDARGTGKETLKQKASDCMDENNEKYKINDCYETELHPNGGRSAKELKKFVECTEKYHGYYLARYEASFGSGSIPQDRKNFLTDQKPEVKKSTSINANGGEMTYEKGTLWNFIEQYDAVNVCQNMYIENIYVESDLVNSYAWDTAIVYIQKMGHKYYSNANCFTNKNQYKIKNTGDTKDVVCNIYDLAGNLWELTTEYSDEIVPYNVYHPFVCRGGTFAENFPVAYRRKDISLIEKYVGFRPIMYIY